MSRAVSNMPESDFPTVKDCAKLLLHKCLAQFTRQQQIHAQQGAHYLHGGKDGIPSHDTTPMLSIHLISHVTSQYSNIDADGDDSDDECEQTAVRISLTKDGELLESNQVHDYYYQAQSLANMNFYDFCRCVSLEKIPSKPPADHSNTFQRHELLPPHFLAGTHQLKEHTNESRGHLSNELVPCVIGTSIPRLDSDSKYKLFALSHFKPFSRTNPLILNGQTLQLVFQNYKISKDSKQILKNWNAIHECEDACDAERLHKWAALTSESQALTKALTNFGNDDSIHFDVTSKHNKKSDENF
jgi:hypothetical protein